MEGRVREIAIGIDRGGEAGRGERGGGAVRPIFLHKIWTYPFFTRNNRSPTGLFITHYWGIKVGSLGEHCRKLGLGKLLKQFVVWLVRGNMC
jgi:hypothetical protein